jgi:uncharacterized membrane protein
VETSNLMKRFDTTIWYLHASLFNYTLITGFAAATQAFGFNWFLPVLYALRSSCSGICCARYAIV